MNNITNMVKEIEAIKSKIDFNHFFSEIALTFQYNWANLIVFSPMLIRRDSISIFGDLPKEIHDFIAHDNSIKKYCLYESSPINYQTLLVSNTESDDILPLDKQACLLVPINGLGNEFAGLLLSVPKLTIQPEVLEKLGWYWLMLSPLIYDKYCKLFKNCQKNTMTKRELECIKWAAEGKTSWEISQLLSISQRTVDFHLANCITKTDSINRQQAIVKCVLDGQLLGVSNLV